MVILFIPIYCTIKFYTATLNTVISLNSYSTWQTMLMFQDLNGISTPFGSFLLFFFVFTGNIFFLQPGSLYTAISDVYVIFLLVCKLFWGGGVFMFINPDLQQALVRWVEKIINFFFLMLIQNLWEKTTRLHFLASFAAGTDRRLES